jgi:hypothetical protein
LVAGAFLAKTSSISLVSSVLNFEMEKETGTDHWGIKMQILNSGLHANCHRNGAILHQLRDYP